MNTTIQTFDIHKSQSDMIFDMLVKNQFVPTLSLVRLGIYQYNARIHELRKIGYCIESIHNKELGLWGFYLKVD